MINLYVGNVYTIILFINNQKIKKWSLANFVSVTLANLAAEFYIFKFKLEFNFNLRNWFFLKLHIMLEPKKNEIRATIFSLKYFSRFYGSWIWYWNNCMSYTLLLETLKMAKFASISQSVAPIYVSPESSGKREFLPKLNHNFTWY